MLLVILVRVERESGESSKCLSCLPNLAAPNNFMFKIDQEFVEVLAQVKVF